MGDFRFNLFNCDLVEGGILICLDFYVLDVFVKGFLGDIIMNRRFGIEIINDDLLKCFLFGDKYILF